MPSPSKQPKQEDPDFDELMSDDEQEEDEDYQEVDEETGFTISDPLKRPITSPMSCHDIYTQIQEGAFSKKIFLYSLTNKTVWPKQV